MYGLVFMMTGITAPILIETHWPEPTNTSKLLIKRMGSPNYKIREQAFQQLYKNRWTAMKALYVGTQNESVEVARRCEMLLKRCFALPRPIKGTYPSLFQMEYEMELKLRNGKTIKAYSEKEAYLHYVRIFNLNAPEYLPVYYTFPIASQAMDEYLHYLSFIGVIDEDMERFIQTTQKNALSLPKHIQTGR